jgi:hypothetical protein
MPDAVESWFDHELFFFTCTECGYRPANLTVGSIREDQQTLDCPNCLFTNDLSIPPNSIELATARDSASEKDKKEIEAGNIITHRIR